jgi:hypothetical protein
MLLAFLTIVLMAGVGYAFLREGVLTAFTMCCNVFLAGLLAFNFWEPVAEVLEPMFPTWDPSEAHFPPLFWGYEDALCLMAIFLLALGLLRLTTNNLASKEVEYAPWLQRPGAVVVGVITGYLIAGFLLCVVQTLPWGQHFMGFESQSEKRSGILRVLPPDRVWLALMHRAGAYPLTAGESEADTFDANGSFEFRYERFRRYDDDKSSPNGGRPRPYNREYAPDQLGAAPR